MLESEALPHAQDQDFAKTALNDRAQPSLGQRLPGG